jgi:uncharacterized protein with FMN-binding domain
MKKLVLSMVVIVAFALYSVYIRSTKTEKASTVPITTPLILSTPSSSQVNVTDTSIVHTGKYKDGMYTGKSVDVFYGFIQVKAVVQNGQLTDVQMLRQPDDRGESIEINSVAMPILQKEAIQAQTTKIDIVSGATDSSQGFIQSLDSALSQAI